MRVRLGRVGGGLVATPLPRGAGVLTSLVRADGLLVVPAGLEGHHAGRGRRGRLLRGVGEIDRTIVATGSHDLVLDLAASALREARPRAHARLLERRLARRSRRAARRAVPRRRLAPARPGDRRVHAALVDRCAGPRRRRRAPRPSRAGADRAPRQPARPRGPRRPRAARPALRQPPARGRDTRAARRGAPARREARSRQRRGLRARGAHPPRGRGRRSRRPARTAASACSPRRARSARFVPVTREPYDLVLAPEPTRGAKLCAAVGAARRPPSSARRSRPSGGYDAGEMGRRIRP